MAKRLSATAEKYAAYEFAEFDKATYFTVSDFHGRGTRVTTKFATPQEAIVFSSDKPRSVVYAVAPYSTIHLSPARYDEWVQRWEKNQGKAKSNVC